jgi:hypothetical protein
MEKLVFQVNLQLLNDWGLIKRHPLHDVAVLSIAKLGKMGTNGRLQTELSLAVTNCSPTIRNWAGWPTDACVLFGGIDDASDAYILGYPVELLNGRLPLEVSRGEQNRTTVVSKAGHFVVRKTGRAIKTGLLLSPSCPQGEG